MVTFDYAASHHDGVTLVSVSLRDIDGPTRVTVRNRLDGPVWPPRSEGVPEAGWTAAGFDGVVGPGSQTLGYATPAPPEDPPVELAEAVPAPDAEAVGERTDRPADVLRELGDPSPPGDAVPTAATGHRTAAPTPRRAERDDGVRSVSLPESGDVGPDRNASDATDSRDATVALPPALGPWLAEMERRADTAETLAAAETVPEATAAVRDAGGLDEVRALAAAADERQLRTLAKRARSLAQRRAAATIPVETLSALA